MNTRTKELVNRFIVWEILAVVFALAWAWIWKGGTEHFIGMFGLQLICNQMVVAWFSRP